jgi:hypothetical protein
METRAQIAFVEMEVPDPLPRQGQISFVEIEVPDPTPRYAQIAFVELEVPDQTPRRATISFVEMEVPSPSTRMAQISFVEIEVPEPTPRRAQLAFVEIEVPEPLPRRAQISFVEIEVPAFITVNTLSDLRRLLGDFTHLEFSDNELRGYLSYAAQEVARQGLLVQERETITLQPGVTDYTLHPRWIHTYALIHEADERTLTLLTPETYRRFGKITPTIPPGAPMGGTIAQGRFWVTPTPDATYTLDHKFFALPLLAGHEQVYEVEPWLVLLPIWRALAMALRTQGKLGPSQTVDDFFGQLLARYAFRYRASARDSRDESAMPR